MPTDDHDHDPDLDQEGLTPREEQVRRLLADARHTGPAPDDVVTRMDAVLADLRGETGARPAPATRPRSTPADLAAARRRRRVRSWVLAAAAVVVVGIGADQLADSGLGGGSGDASSSGGSASSVESRDDAGGDKAPEPRLVAPGPGNGVVPLDGDRFGRQLQRLRGSLERVPAEDQAASGSAQAKGQALRSTPECRADGPGRAVAVRYDGQPGVAVFRPVHGDTQVVDLFLCSHDGPYRSITLPAP